MLHWIVGTNSGSTLISEMCCKAQSVTYIANTCFLTGYLRIYGVIVIPKSILSCIIKMEHL